MVIGKRGEEADVVGIVPRGDLVVVEVRDKRNVGSRAREIRDMAEAGNAKLGLCSVKFSNNIGLPFCFADDNHRPEITRLGFAIQRLFNTSVAHQN